MPLIAVLLASSCMLVVICPAFPEIQHSICNWAKDIEKTDLNLRSITVTMNLDTHQPEKIVILESGQTMQVYELPVGSVNDKKYQLHINPNKDVAREWTAVQSIKIPNEEHSNKHLERFEVVPGDCVLNAPHSYFKHYRFGGPFTEDVYQWAGGGEVNEQIQHFPTEKPYQVITNGQNCKGYVLMHGEKQGEFFVVDLKAWVNFGYVGDKLVSKHLLYMQKNTVIFRPYPADDDNPPPEQMLLQLPVGFIVHDVVYLIDQKYAYVYMFQYTDLTQLSGPLKQELITSMWQPAFFQCSKSGSSSSGSDLNRNVTTDSANAAAAINANEKLGIIIVVVALALVLIALMFALFNMTRKSDQLKMTIRRGPRHHQRHQQLESQTRSTTGPGMRTNNSKAFSTSSAIESSSSAVSSKLTTATSKRPWEYKPEKRTMAKRAAR